MKSRAFALSCVLSSLCAGQPFEVYLGTQVGIPRGYVKVGENNLAGDRLSLHGDLGIDASETLDLGAVYCLTAAEAAARPIGACGSCLWG